MQKLGECLGLGVEALRAAFGVGERAAGDIERLPGGGMRRLGAQCGRFRLGDGGLRLFGGERERGEIGMTGSRRIERGEFRLDRGGLVCEPGKAVVVFADNAVERVAAGGEVGERAGKFAEGLFGGGQDGVGFGHAGIGTGALLRIGVDVLLESVLFLGEPAECGLGVGRELALALDVGRKLHQPPVEFRHAFARARFLALERLTRDDEPLQPGRGCGLGFAQRRQFGRRQRLAGRGFGLRPGAFGDDAHRQVLGVLGFGQFGVRRDPAQVEQGRFGAANLPGDVAIAHGLARLCLQCRDLRAELIDHVFEPQQVLLGCAQPQFGLVTPRMQTGNAGGFFQHAPALLGLGLDDLADAALMHERGRARAGRSVGQQNLHVARPHFAAVDPIGRALLALDPPRHVEALVLVELGGRLARAVVDVHRDFGVVARRPDVGAGEDHVLHVGGAQRLVRGLPHDPAQRLDEIRLAAAVRPDHAGEARLDQEIGRLDERLKAEQA